MKLTSFIVYANSLLATYVYPRCAAIITKFAPSRLNMRKRLRVDRMYSSERDHHNILTPLPTPINKSHFSVRRLTRLSNTVGVICVLMNDLWQNRVLGPSAPQKNVRVWILLLLHLPIPNLDNSLTSTLKPPSCPRLTRTRITTILRREHMTRRLSPHSIQTGTIEVWTETAQTQTWPKNTSPLHDDVNYLSSLILAWMPCSLLQHILFPSYRGTHAPFVLFVLS